MFLEVEVAAFDAVHGEEVVSMAQLKETKTVKSGRLWANSAGKRAISAGALYFQRLFCVNLYRFCKFFALRNLMAFISDV